MATYTVPSGDRIWAGRDVVLPDPDDVSFTWPPPSPVTIPAVAGVNAPLHPKVLDLGTQWNGYRYWMAFTPYPTNNDDTLENPSIVASNDKATWVAPATNPIVPAPAGASTGLLYNSDPHLIFENDTLYMLYRKVQHPSGGYAGGATESLYVLSTTDGVTWTTPVLYHEETPEGAGVLISPATELHNGVYYMWVVRRDVTPLAVDLMTATSLAGTWSARTRTNLDINDAPSYIWHIDVCRIPNGWAMLISTRFGTTQDLWLAYSKDGVTWTAPAQISSGSPGVYRSGITRKVGGFDFYVNDYDVRSIRLLDVVAEV